MSIFREHKTVSDRSASDRRRHKQKIDRAIKEGIHNIVADESIIGQDGKKKIKIPVRGIKEYRFVYGNNENNKRVGYVRVATADELWAIVECVINTENQEELRCDVHRQIAFLAQQKGISWITSWQQPPNALQRYYTTRKRSKAWPMIMVGADSNIANIPIYVSDYF